MCNTASASLLFLWTLDKQGRGKPVCLNFPLLLFLSISFNSGQTREGETIAATTGIATKVSHRYCNQGLSLNLHTHHTIWCSSNWNGGNWFPLFPLLLSPRSILFLVRSLPFLLSFSLICFVLPTFPSQFFSASSFYLGSPLFHHLHPSFRM